MAWQNLITGAANGAINPLYGTELSRQRHEAAQQHQRLGHDTKQQLAEAIYKNAELYGGHGTPVGRQLHAMVPQVTSLPDDGTLDAKISQLAARQSQLVSQGEQQLAQDHAGAQPIRPVAQPAPPTVQSSNPFAGMIASSSAQTSTPPAAQPATNPLTSPAPGGGSSDAGAFRPEPSPAAGQPPPTGPLGAPAPSPSAPVQPGPVSANVPGLSPLGAPPNIQPDIDEFNSSGYMSPVMRAMIPGQLEIHHGQQMLSAIEPLLQQMSGDHLSIPDLLKTQMRISALSGGKGGGMGIAGLAGLLHPVNVPGMLRTDALPPGTIDAFGNPIDPETTPFVRVQKSLLGGPDQYYPEMGGTKVQIQPDPESKTGWARVIYDATGNVIKRTLGMAPPVGFAPQTSKSTLDVPGQPPQTTTTQRQRTIQGIDNAPATPAGKTLQTRPPAGPITGIPGSSAGKSSVAATQSDGPAPGDHSYIAENYRKWIKGGTLAPKEQTAVVQAAGAHGWPQPEDYLSAGGQEAVTKVQPILDEILTARKLLRERGLLNKSETDSKLAMGQAWAKYKYLRVKDPLAAVISDLSFDRIRSVGQALQGTGSRALPIFNLGLEHTPVLGLNSDSAQLMDSKLEGMQRRAEESLAAAKAMTKSGIVPPAKSILPVGVPQPGQTFGGGKVLHVERVP